MPRSLAFACNVPCAASVLHSCPVISCAQAAAASIASAAPTLTPAPVPVPAPVRKRLAFTERAADVFEYPSERFLLNLPADYDFSSLERDCAEAAEREECAARERRARTMATARACVMTDSLLLEDGDVNANLRVGSPPTQTQPAAAVPLPLSHPPPPPLLDADDTDEEVRQVPTDEKGKKNGMSMYESLDSCDGSSSVSPASQSPASRRPVPTGSALNELNGMSDAVVFAAPKPVPLPVPSFNPDWAISFVDSDMSENENEKSNEETMSEEEATPPSGSPQRQRTARDPETETDTPAAPTEKTPSPVASPDCNSALIRPLEVDV